MDPTPPATSLVQLLQERARAEQAPFLTHLDTSSVHSYRAVWETALRLERILERLEVTRKSRVALVAKNHWLFYPLLVACAARQAVLAPIDPDLHRDEFAFVFEHCAPALTIMRDAKVKGVPETRGRKLLLADLLELVQREPLPSVPVEPAAPRRPTDAVLMIYTSGTTGSGKSVMLTEANLLANARSLATRYGLGPTDRLYCVLPTTHMNAIMLTGITPLTAGSHVFLSSPFSYRFAKFYWRNVAEYKITVCSLVPSIMAMLLELFPTGADAPIDHVRFSFCGAAPLPAKLWRAFEERFKIPVYQGYGLTETTCWAVSIPPGEPRHFDTVGTPLDSEIKIDASRVEDAPEPVVDRRAASEAIAFDDRRGQQAAPTIGEVLIRAPIVGPGYYKNPKLSKSLMTPDGFFRTGDYGFVDDEGYLHIVGRLKDIIIRNGTNIFGRDVDAVLAQHEAVQECKTVGVPDDLVGERVHAVCVLRPGATATEAELRDHARQRLSEYMWPDRVTVMGYLPTGATGKIAIATLRSILTGRLSEEICASLNTRKYKRAPPSDPAALTRLVQTALVRGEPIRFLTYWGFGHRDSIADVDHAALARLKDMLDGAARVRQAPAQLTLMFTDVHAVNNRIPDQRAERYQAAVESAARAIGFECVRLSDVWRTGGMTRDTITAGIRTPEFLEHWASFPLREALVEQAKKHHEGTEFDRAAMAYYYGCTLESKLVQAAYPSSVFLTYNDPSFDVLLPPLPKLYLHSFKEGVSVKPWFAG